MTDVDRGSTSSGSSRALTFLPALAMVVTVFGILVGNGVILESGGVGDGDSIADTPTFIAPAGPAFSIWSLIYAFLVAYVVWQALPVGAGSARARRILWPAVASLVLNAAWILVVEQLESAWGSVVVMLLLLGSLIAVHRVLKAAPPESTVERWVVDIGFGLYLGWVNVATAANITFALVLAGVDPPREVAVPIAVVVLAVLVGVAAYVLPRVSEPLAVGAAMTWGLAWICVGRLTTTPESVVVAVAAAVGALLTVGLALRTAARAPSMAG